jgi:hypothetical protein
MAETKFQTSFIPKQPVTEESRRPSGGGGGILFLLGFLFLIISLASAAGVFIWNKTILSNIKEGEFNLAESKKGFDNNTIATYTKLDNRIDVADSLLKKHIKASALFPKLGMNTLQTVRFNNFNYSYTGTGNVAISMAGEAADYESMALQAKQFTSAEASDAFKSPIFSSFSKNRDRVVFTFTSGIDPYVVDYYRAKVGALEATQPATAVPVGSIPSQPTNQ